ncbi:MAG: methyltransferase domain-containing protein [Candidatus Methanoplasma sp.]|jgi:ubiquinone/menaquinone biosynthesis C-methylase UbiE|nr:methyltransferase domain-containing protein [Candidatus Methanoplasma sp.]
MNNITEDVKEYYGKTLSGKKDLKTNACCCGSDSYPPEVREALALIADEIHEKAYGCGSPLPPLLNGLNVLDLGCGTGRDVYVASKLVGENGHVTGIDMTDEQLSVARKYIGHHRDKFGYSESNVTFRQGYIENLAECGIEDSSIDVVISNCVLNLSPSKESVFKEIFRVLKPGGELYFSDVFADRRIDKKLSSDPVLRGECLGGAMYHEDFRRLMASVGFADFRYTNIRNLTIDNEEIEKLVGMVGFSSRTVRAFKIESLEDRCEDYGQVAYYNGGIPGSEHFFDLDDHHRFVRGKPMLVCGNTAAMVSETRFAPFFRVAGDRSVHYGAFDCSSGDGEKCTDKGNCC